MSDGDAQQEGQDGGHGWKYEWIPKYLLTLQINGNIGEACRAVGISRSTSIRVRNEYPKFADAHAEATELAIDDLEKEVFIRAKNRSDFLAWNILKKRRPQVYGDVPVEGGQINVEALAAQIAEELQVDREELLVTTNRVVEKLLAAAR